MKKMSAREKQKMLQERRESVVPSMARAQEVANVVFGITQNLYAVHEIFDYTIGADDEGLAAFKADLKEAIEGAQVAHGTQSPTPEQVFKIFEELNYEGDDEDEGEE